MVGIKYDLIDAEAIFQGADWYKQFQIIDASTKQPYDLTGYTVASAARKTYTDAAPAFIFSCSVVDPANGIIQIALTNDDTSAIPKGNYRYDVELAEPAPSTIIHKPITPSTVQVIEEYTR